MRPINDLMPVPWSLVPPRSGRSDKKCGLYFGVLGQPYQPEVVWGRDWRFLLEVGMVSLRKKMERFQHGNHGFGLFEVSFFWGDKGSAFFLAHFRDFKNNHFPYLQQLQHSIKLLAKSVRFWGCPNRRFWGVPTHLCITGWGMCGCLQDQGVWP